MKHTGIKSMQALICLLIALGVTMNCYAQNSFAKSSHFKIIKNSEAKRVDITIDGKPFTSYIYPDSLRKPVLYPIRAANGALITRGWPLVPRAGEPVDHPHHIGLWFNYENVNGLDFWNNSSSIAMEKRSEYGTIRHASINKISANDHNAELNVTAYWEMPDGTKLLKQDTKYIFAGTGHQRSIEMIVKLTAQKEDVSFTDIKDGLIGLRVARELEQPSEASVKVTDDAGGISDVPVKNTKVATGLYRSSKGKEGDDVWGTRAKWVNLMGSLNGEPVSVVILDHPKNVGYPTYWHARGYGLFAANPLGQKVFSKGKEALNYKLKARASVIFKYKLLINSGSHLTDNQLNSEARKFAKGNE